MPDRLSRALDPCLGRTPHWRWTLRCDDGRNDLREHMEPEHASRKRADHKLDHNNVRPASG